MNILENFDRRPTNIKKPPYLVGKGKVGGAKLKVGGAAATPTVYETPPVDVDAISPLFPPINQM